MVVDPRMLRSALPPKPISVSTPCRFCGYDLVGLMTSDLCPECGKPIRVKGTLRFEDEQITEAPVAYLRVLALGALLMFCGWLGMAGTMIPLGFAANVAWGVTFTLAAAAWWVGVLLVSRPRPATEKSTENRKVEWFWLRIGSRLTQAFWVLCGGIAVVAVSLPSGAPDWLRASGLAAAIIASAGLIPVVLLVANFGYWAADTTLALRMRALAFLVAIIPAIQYLAIAKLIDLSLGLLRGVGGEPKGAPVVGFIVIGITILLIPAAAMAWCLWNFSQDASWSVANHHKAVEKEERFRERSEAEARRAALASTGVDPAALPGFNLAKSSEVAPQPNRSLAPGNRAKGMSKKKRPDANPYDLAEE